MSWNQLPCFALCASLCWLVGILAAFRQQKVRLSLFFSGLGTAIFFVFVVGLWVTWGRPPLRTLGETRLWYALFLSAAGSLLYLLLRNKWIYLLSLLMAMAFVAMNLLKPEMHGRELMPALQSVWFVPHVMVYMLAYAVLGVAAVYVLCLWLRRSPTEVAPAEMKVCDNLVRTGWVLLTLGMAMGALWAKQAWGDYWSWDPKETWAAATWLGYLLYLHLRVRVCSHNLAFFLVVFCFLLLQMCWYGINYLPAAQGTSIHVY